MRKFPCAEFAIHPPSDTLRLTSRVRISTTMPFVSVCSPQPERGRLGHVQKQCYCTPCCVSIGRGALQGLYGLEQRQLCTRRNSSNTRERSIMMYARRAAACIDQWISMSSVFSHQYVLKGASQSEMVHGHRHERGAYWEVGRKGTCTVQTK